MARGFQRWISVRWGQRHASDMAEDIDGKAKGNANFDSFSNGRFPYGLKIFLYYRLYLVSISAVIIILQ